MKHSFLLMLLIFVEVNSSLKEWEDFKAIYGKEYANKKDENFHKKTFLKNFKLIEEHNRLYEQGLVGFSIKVNNLSDHTQDELTSPSKYKSDHVIRSTRKSKSIFLPGEEIPDSIDWRDYGVITPVPDQIFCESCWAFAVVGTIEAHIGIYNQKNVSLSQQNLVDCVDPLFTCNQDLKRDMIEKTYQYIIDNKGIDTADSYPYETYDVGNCRFTSGNVGGTIASYVNITEGDEEELKAVVGTVGPVTVSITTDMHWSAYKDGIYYNKDCMNTSKIFNHAVVVVGYGSENSDDYWLVKNSWGTWFGQEGYIKMARNRDNNCGIASIARYPVL